MDKNTNCFIEKMHKHLITFKEEKQCLLSKSDKNKFLYSDLSDNFFPKIKYSLLQYINEYGILLDEYVNHVGSLQAFTFNLLYLPLQKQVGLLKCLSNNIGEELILIKNFEFKFSPTSGIFNVWKGDENLPEKYATVVDIYIETISNKGDFRNFFFVVKFTEVSFENCNGYDSKINTSELTKSHNFSEKLQENSKLSFLERFKLEGIKFENKFNPKLIFQPDVFVSKSLFERFHKCLTNHFLSYKMENKTYFCLVYHNGNTEILEQWNCYKYLCKDTSTLFEIKASDIVKSERNSQYKKYLTDRYLIK